MKKSLLIISLLASLSSISQISYADSASNDNNPTPPNFSGNYEIEITDDQCTLKDGTITKYDQTFALTTVDQISSNAARWWPVTTMDAVDASNGFNTYLQTCHNTAPSFNDNMKVELNLTRTSETNLIFVLQDYDLTYNLYFTVAGTPDQFMSHNEILTEIDNIMAIQDPNHYISENGTNYNQLFETATMKLRLVE